MSRDRFRDGALAVAPILLGTVPFAFVTGIAAVDGGLTAAQGAAMSVIVFAGASQLAAIDLMRQDAALAVIVATALIINVRFVMYSASLAEYLAAAPVRTRLGVAYLMTDQAYALSIVDYVRHDRPLGDRIAYYLGAGLLMWSTWVAATVLGVLLGAEVPEDLSLDFAVPLVFIALVVPVVRDRAGAGAAAVSGFVAVAAFSLPYNLSLVTAAGAGIAAGLMVGRQA